MSDLLKIKSAFVVKADEPNLNQRIYTKSVVEKIVKEFHGSEKRHFGTLGMFENNRADISKASHLVEDLYFSDGNLLADIVILNTPVGKVLNENIENVCFRLQGMGSINLIDGNEVLLDDYKLLAINAVFKTDAS